MKYDVYDFDGTIYDGDSGIDIFFFALKKYPKIILRIPLIIWMGLLKLLKIKKIEDFKKVVFAFVKDVDNIDDFVEEFWKKHEKKLKSFWVNKRTHSRDVIISASCVFWLNYIKEKYDVHALIATEMDLTTGEVVGNNCHGKEKVKLFYSEFPKGIVDKMYTDSINDLPLIEEAREGYLVKKNKIYNYYSYKPNFIVRFWRWGWGIYHKNEEFWSYIVVGLLTTIVSIAVKWGLLFTILDAKKEIELQIAIIISWIAAVLFAYVTNRFYVFKSKSKDLLKEFTSFVGSRILTLLMEMFIMWFFITFLKLDTKVWVIIWTIICQVLITLFNYIFSKIFVFKKK